MKYHSLDNPSDSSVPTAVRNAAHQLRKEILNNDEEGRFLGSEEELIARLDVSRPTFRQVARLLEQEQLVTIKRGPRGGFFSRKPSFNSVVHQASICLIAHEAKREQLLSFSYLLNAEAARLAASNPDLRRREKIMEFLAYESQAFEAKRRHYWFDFIWRFSLEVLDIADNPALTMFIYIIKEFSEEAETGKVIKSNHLRGYLDQQKKLAEAIAEGDSEYAQFVATRLYKSMYDHLLEGMAG